MAHLFAQRMQHRAAVSPTDDGPRPRARPRPTPTSRSPAGPIQTHECLPPSLVPVAPPLDAFRAHRRCRWRVVATLPRALLPFTMEPHLRERCCVCVVLASHWVPYFEGGRMGLTAEVARELLHYDAENGSLTWRPRARQSVRSRGVVASAMLRAFDHDRRFRDRRRRRPRRR